MSQHPPEPHLFEVSISNDGKPFTVRAASTAEAKNFVLANHVTIRRLSPVQAFRAGASGASILNAKPEYADVAEQEEIDLPAAGEVQHG